MSIQTQIDRIKGNISSAYDAVEERGGTLPQEQNSGNLATAIATIPQGSGGAVEGIDIDAMILFIDYDGTPLYSWTQEQLQAATELPPNPTHEGLISQGWNWSLSGLKEWNKDAVVGAVFTTESGATEIYLDLTYPNNATLVLSQTIANGTIIDWGDGERGTFTIPIGNVQGQSLSLQSGKSYNLLFSTNARFTFPTITNIAQGADIDIFCYYEMFLNIYQGSQIVRSTQILYLEDTIVSKDNMGERRYNPTDLIVSSSHSFSLSSNQSAKIETHLGVSERGTGQYNRSGNIGISFDEQGEWSLQGRQWTIVGNDGIYISRDGAYFKIINTEESLSISVKGLSNSKHQEKGRLWVDMDGTLKVS